jgi:hypothetical protein
MRPDVRAIFENLLNRSLDGDLKDVVDAKGLTFLQGVADNLFANPEVEAPTLRRFGHVPVVKAVLERAKALNAPKDAIMHLAQRCKDRGGWHRRDRDPGNYKPAFHLDLPYQFKRLDARHGPHVYLPVNRHYGPLGRDRREWRGSYDDYADQAWHFRRDPLEIEGVWLAPPNVSYLYGGGDTVVYKSARAFMARHRDRLRRVLAEAVGGLGGLNPDPEW